MTRPPLLLPGAIARLFPSTPLERFLAECYPGQLVVEDGPPERLGELGEARLFDHPLALIDKAFEDQAVVYIRCPNGRTQQISVDRPTAKRLYQNGHTVSIEGADLVLPLVRTWAAALRRELGYAADVREVALLLSPPGDAVPMHFDGTEVLVVHLRGHKRWKIAANDAIRNPDFAYFPDEPNGVGVRDVVGASDRSFEASFDWPGEMPATAHVHTMRPGSALFVPRGWWHATHAHDATASLTFKVGARSALSLVLDALARRLRRIEAWRTPAPLWGPPAQRGRVQTELRALLAELPCLLDPAVLATLLDAPRSFRRCRGARFAVEPPPPPGRTWALVVALGDQRQSIMVDVDPDPLCQILSVAGGTIVESDLQAVLPESSLVGVRALIGRLVELGVIEPVAEAGPDR